MNSALMSTFDSSGADETLIADFRAVADTNRYPRDTVQVWIAKFVVGRGGGANKDTPLLELCHLIAGLDSLTGGGTDQRMLFFLGVERALPRYIRSFFEPYTDTPVVTLSAKGLSMTYSDSSFEVRFGRMPFLMALYDFLMGMGGYQYHSVFNQIFDEMSNDKSTLSSVKTATNALSSHMRKYRRAHMSWAENDEKFDRIYPFLRGRSENGELIIDDSSILDFWNLHSHGKEFRGYKTVFGSFVDFMRHLERTIQGRDLHGAATIGSDRDAGEVDLQAAEYGLSDLGEWRSPLNTFDEEELKGIKFFKGSSERKPMEELMYFGPYAVKLPLAFIRLDVFSPIQSGITTDLQVKRGIDSINCRITCEDAKTYIERRNVFSELLKHVVHLQKATLHAVSKTMQREEGSNVVNLREEPLGQISEAAMMQDDFDLEDAAGQLAHVSKKAYESLNRKGFDEIEDSNDPRGDAFGHAAGALVTMAGVFEQMLSKLDRMDGAENKGLSDLFDQDVGSFRQQFEKIYGVHL